jgi:CRP-like cAMP-binding protein
MLLSLQKFFLQYADIDPHELEHILSNFKRREIKKNDYLLQAGQVCSDIVFVESGCLRLFYIENDVDISVWFSFNDNSSIEIYSFVSGRPSDYYIQAIEDTTLWYLPKEELNKLYDPYPKMQEMMRKFWEDVILNLLDRFTALQKKSAEERYRDILAKPAYMQRIPQKYLASFIGVTPTSLSRIRKNIR